jgi:hypothetical protein
LGRAETCCGDHVFDLDGGQPIAAHGLRRAARRQAGRSGATRDRQQSITRSSTSPLGGFRPPKGCPEMAGLDVKQTLGLSGGRPIWGRKVGIKRVRLAKDQSSRQSLHPDASTKSVSLDNSGRVVKRRVRMTARVFVSPQDLKRGSDHKFSRPR